MLGERIEIKISERMYNGDFGKGSVFEHINFIELYDYYAKINTEIEFCANNNGQKANINIALPINISQEDRNEIKNILNEITTNSEYKYNESHYSKECFDPKSLSYVDVFINGEEYEINKSNNILNKLIHLLQCEKSSTAANKAYNNIIKEQKDDISEKPNNEDDMIV